MPACCCSQACSGKPLLTHTSARDSWTLTASLAQSTVGSLLLCPESWCTQDFVVPFKNLFSWELSVLLPNPQVGKSIVGPRTFATVWELLWCNCSLICVSVWWLCNGTNGDLSPEDLCHTLCLPDLLQTEPLSPWQASADPCLCRRHLNTQRQVWLQLLWRPLLLSLGPGAQKVFFVFCFFFFAPSEHLWKVWGLILNMIFAPPTNLLGLCPWTWGIFFLVGYNILLSMVVQQLVTILVFSQDKMAHPSTLPSYRRGRGKVFNSLREFIFFFILNSLILNNLGEEAD